MLNMTPKEIKDLISLREEYWEYDFETNCYAFALGLDVPESNIVKNGYTLGVIAANMFKIPVCELAEMSFEQRFLLDLKALKIACIETSPESPTYVENTGPYERLYWTVSLLCRDDNFHFLRKNYDGEWYHKVGCFGFPIKTDSNKDLITDPKKASIFDYEYVKSYQLHICRRSNSIFSN